jgi:hypothetical protein
LSSPQEEKPTADDVQDYLEIMVDAARQRSNDEDMKRYKNQADCVQAIFEALKKYEINTVDYIVHTLLSVVVIPIQMLEPDPKEREKAMKSLAIRCVRILIAMQKRDEECKGTTVGQELDKLRYMIEKSQIFEPDKKEDVSKV